MDGKNGPQNNHHGIPLEEGIADGAVAGDPAANHDDPQQSHTEGKLVAKSYPYVA